MQLIPKFLRYKIEETLVLLAIEQKEANFKKKSYEDKKLAVLWEQNYRCHCSSQDNLDMYHKDGNPANHDRSNLIIKCSSCASK